MRIGIDIRELEWNKVTGIGRYILNFLSYVTGYDRENEYVLFGNQKTISPILGINAVLKIIPEFNKIYWEQIVLAKQIRKENLNIFFSPYYKCPVFSSAKTVATVYDVYPWIIKEFDPFIKIVFKKCYYKFMFYNADLIIAVSEYTRQMILKITKVNPDKIKVVYGSADEKFRVLDKKECLQNVKKLYGIDRDFILYVGNLQPHKNLRRLVQAYGLLDTNLITKYQLVIVAPKDNLFFDLYQLIKDLNLEKDVTFTGLVEDPSLVYLYNAATVYISVSLNEGFGLPFIEAMACGTPVISANVTALPEIIGEAGILVNPLDIKQILKTMEMVLCDESLRQEMAQKGLRRVKNFSQSREMSKILNIFKQLYMEQQ